MEAANLALTGQQSSFLVSALDILMTEAEAKGKEEEEEGEGWLTLQTLHGPSGTSSVAAVPPGTPCSTLSISAKFLDCYSVRNLFVGNGGSLSGCRIVGRRLWRTRRQTESSSSLFRPA